MSTSNTTAEPILLTEDSLSYAGRLGEATFYPVIRSGDQIVEGDQTVQDVGRSIVSTLDNGNEVASTGYWSGALEDRYRLEGVQAGDSITLYTSYPDGVSYFSDTILEVSDQNGNSLFYNDDYDGTLSRLDFVAEEGVIYYVNVGKYSRYQAGSAQSGYQLNLESSSDQVSLFSESGFINQMELVGNVGSLIVNSRGEYRYQLSPSAQALDKDDLITEQFELELESSDGSLTTQTLIFNVQSVDDAPVIDPSQRIVVQEGNGVVTGQIAYSDIDGGDVAFGAGLYSVGDFRFFNSETGLPIGFVFDSDGSFSMDTDQAVYQYLGQSEEVSFGLYVYSIQSNGSQGAGAYINFTVTGQGESEVFAEPDVFSLTEGGYLSGNLLINDSVGSVDYGYNGEGSYGYLYIHSDGYFSYSLNDFSLKVGETAQETFEYTISRNGVSATSTVTINIEGANQAPTVSPSFFNVQYGDAIQGQLLASDPEGDAVEFSLASWSQQYDGITINSNGTYLIDTTQLSGRLAFNDYRYFSLNYQVVDAEGAASSDYISVFVSRYRDGQFIRGTELADSLVGTALNDEIRGGEGNDTITGCTGSDLMYGGSGDDTLAGGLGHDDLYGGSGHDRIRGEEGHDLAYGGSGDDVITSSYGDDELYGDSGHDQLYGGAGIDELYGSDGNDQLYGGSGRDLLEGGNGDDILHSGSGMDLLVGGAGNDLIYAGIGTDELYGGDDNDTLQGDQGTDTLYGDAGDDLLYGGLGNDSLYGGVGNDSLSGGDSQDTLRGDEGNDILYGGYGSDRLFGGSDNDELHGGADNDQLSGSVGNDILYGGSGDDELVGGSGSDQLHGGSSHDLLYGGSGVDQLSGGAGGDHLYGGLGTDQLYGDVGDDLLDGGTGFDTLEGGSGNDTYIFARGYRTDTIIENDATEGMQDRLVFGSNIRANQLWFRQEDQDLIVSVIGTTDDRVVVKDWYQGAAHQIEEFHSGDGLTLTDTQVQSLVDAMSSMTPPPVGQMSLTRVERDQLSSVITASWV